ncbi:hypothetical protein [Streptomyces sp. M3]|uniref:hypothetical protein n=1 Tax=Streptomyces sp. M3 TaxID=295102 RepID=UPI001F50C08A|nr:hypothetical protein [Streptomyces sp. M3]
MSDLPFRRTPVAEAALSQITEDARPLPPEATSHRGARSDDTPSPTPADPLRKPIADQASISLTDSRIVASVRLDFDDPQRRTKDGCPSRARTTEREFDMTDKSRRSVLKVALGGVGLAAFPAVALHLTRGRRTELGS